MSLVGSRALVRIAMNLSCEVQTAMAIEHVKETEFYEQLTGRKYPKEYGERFSARRRGAKFEANLFQNNAALLRATLADFCGVDADEMYVRNLEQETASGVDGRIARLSRTRQIIEAAIQGRDYPHLVIQPQLLFPLGASRRPSLLIAPDFMVWSPRSAAYIPGELKSFIVRENFVDPGDLERTRLQAAVEILSLKHEFGRYGLAKSVGEDAIFVFSTPYGLKPAPPHLETLHGPLEMIRRATDVLGKVSRKLDALSVPEHPPLRELYPELKSSFCEKCITTCTLADVCRTRLIGMPQQLGDVAGDKLGDQVGIDRLVALLSGAHPENPIEANLAQELKTAARDLGVDQMFTRRRVA